jgi:hypothetical protein
MVTGTAAIVVVVEVVAAVAEGFAQECAGEWK